MNSKNFTAESAHLLLTQISSPKLNFVGAASLLILDLKKQSVDITLIHLEKTFFTKDLEHNIQKDEIYTSMFVIA